MLERYKLVVFDVDGTLYSQKKLRFFMVFSILKSLFLRREYSFVSVIKHYRRFREAAADIPENFEDVIIEQTARKVGLSEEAVRDIVQEWIYERPLRYLKFCRYPYLVETFSFLRKKNIKIGIFSDYPAKEKVRALGLFADYFVSSGEADVPKLKPDPRGLEKLMRLSSVPQEKTLLIGDRWDKDAEAAKRAGVSYLIRSSGAKKDAEGAFAHYKALIRL